MSWTDICEAPQYQGCWLALDACRYDEATGKASAGLVVDADENLNELCLRVREADLSHCAIVFCDGPGCEPGQPAGNTRPLDAAGRSNPGMTR